MTALEAVAKAICCPDEDERCVGGRCEAAMHLYATNATAAIAAYKAAIREPTKEMMAAGVIDTHKVWLDNFDEGDACEVFQAMLDKAE